MEKKLSAGFINLVGVILMHFANLPREKIGLSSGWLAHQSTGTENENLSASQA